ncbi:hypothetical protein HU200_016605 [Digitaria exilis]|uniref:Uncharacterized protein n=1 Tax=Digitaria exilis TaxID=1010633 RepID=A0A835F7F6_9POAL|nr:hypothetical protein HU200_016605 [Digitaria exilis]CAB3491316.1 unnamed protein product [Digitaria exilis]
MAKHHLPLLASVLFLAAVMAFPSMASAKLSPTPSPPTAASPMTTPPMANSTTPTAYEMLEQYNFTRGILPQGVTGYVLHPDGSFEVYLPGECNIHASNMQIKYSSRIAGNIHAQSISSLEGVQVEMMLIWFGITEVTRTGDQFKFSAGLISKSFPIDSFANSPKCNS